MKILFVCKWNMGRSQMADELFKLYSKKSIGVSAGTNTILHSHQKLKDVAPLTVKALKEKNIDVSGKTPVRITKELVNWADRVIVMTDKENVPDYLASSQKVTYWEVEDGDGKDYEFHIKMRNQIEALVKRLVSEIG